MAADELAHCEGDAEHESPGGAERVGTSPARADHREDRHHRGESTSLGSSSSW